MRKLLVIAVNLFLSFCALGQTIATFEVELSQPSAGMVVPAQTNLGAVTSMDVTQLTLWQIRNNSSVPIQFQVSRAGKDRMIHWLIDPEGEKETKFRYELRKGNSSGKAKAEMNIIEADGALNIRSGNQDLLRYQFAHADPPAGVDPAYGRSGFIHPLWSPRGQVLTRIQPPDHYHHYGIWNPWTHVLFEGDTLDFWNLNKKEATVRFAKLLGRTDGPVFSEYEVLHQHVVLKSNQEKVALNEVQSVRVYEPSQNYYIADFTFRLSCAGKSPFRILAYRYAGLGWRTTEKWNNKNSEVLTSEGKSRKDADGSTARWCLVQGEIDDQYAGALMMSFPQNYNHPEPLRIWPENQYDRGDMFANFSPTKTRDWELKPGEEYTLRYRFIVFNDRLGAEKAEGAWQNYASQAKIIVK